MHCILGRTSVIMEEKEEMAKDPDATKERFEGDTQERFWDNASQVLFANIKRTYDEYQGVSLDQQRAINQITIQALQNAVETANLVGKQSVRHTDIAIENQWESSAEVSGEAVLAALAVAVANALKKE
jgi:hypothetical protein